MKRKRLLSLVVICAIPLLQACGGSDEPSVPSTFEPKHTKESADFWRQLNAKQKGTLVKFCQTQAAVAAGESDPGQAADPVYSKAYQAVQVLDEAQIQRRLNQALSSNATGTIRSACRTVTTELVAAEAQRRQDARAKRIAAQSCTAKGITADVGNEGTCIDDDSGAKLRVVNRGTTLKLEELAAQLVDTSTTKTLTSDISTERASGMFVIIKLAVTNRLNAPTSFDQGQDQVYLLLGGKEFSQDFDAENQPGESFVWNSEDIQPGETRTGTVIFDIPDASLGEIEKSGNIFVLNFSDAGADIDSAGATIGVIRTYR